MFLDPVKRYATSTPKKLALGYAEDGTTWSWVEFDSAVDRCAAWLVDELGSASGKRVAVIARNHPRQIILQFACVRAGAIFVPFNWRLAPAEIQELIADAAPSLMFCDDEFRVPELTSSVINYDLAELDDLGVVGSVPPADARRATDEPSTLLYTSGTSGRPKGVMVTEQNAFYGNINFGLGSLVSYESVFLCDMPLFHTAGLFAAVRVPVLFGAAVWITAGFNPANTIARIASKELGVTHYFSVPQMATMLWQHPDFSFEKFSNLVLYVTGGAPNPPAQVERFAREGVRFSDGFGMTETGSNFAMPVLDEEILFKKTGSCGVPLMTLETRIVDDAGVDVAQGEVGELWLRGPSITPGYWNQPELTAKAFHDGWFKTGDAAYCDEDGFFYLVDRKKDMYISGGENVYPAEVERIISELHEIADVAVVGIPSERWGEVGRAFVIRREGAHFDEQYVIDHCLARLAKFKVPAEVVITDTIPRTASGKVQKHLLERG